jgi:hypothetical protein
MIASLPARKFSIIKTFEESRNNSSPDDLENILKRDIAKKRSCIMES